MQIDIDGPHRIGDLVDQRYAIKRLIGHGRLAFVYEVYDLVAKTTRAMKRIKSAWSLHSGFDDSIMNDLDEAKGLSSKSTYMVKIHDVSKDDLGIYIVMDYVQAPTLRSLLDSRSLDSNQVIKVLMEVSLGIQEFHRHGRMHRNLNPNTIFVDMNNVTPVIRFAEFSYTFEQTLGVRFSVYSGPEPLNSTIHRASDIYAFGVIAYEALSGTLPVGRYQDLSDLIDDDFYEFYPLIDECLCAKPIHRPSNIDGIVETLVSLAHELDDVVSTDNPYIAVGWTIKYPNLSKYIAALRIIDGGTCTLGAVPPAHMEHLTTWCIVGEEPQQNSNDYGPTRYVELKSYLIGSTPVTVGVWREFCRATNYPMPDEKEDEEPWEGVWIDDHPMTCVTWDDLMRRGGFCDWASAMSGLQLTLPTVNQWEYAARSGKSDIVYPWGNVFDENKLWSSFGKYKDTTASVNRSANIHVNAFGLTDMVGNVWHICKSDTPNSGVTRGGAWTDGLIEVFRCSYIGGRVPNDGDGDVGFRLVAQLG